MENMGSGCLREGWANGRNLWFSSASAIVEPPRDGNCGGVKVCLKVV
ncbi:hypothetical protein PG2093B_0222 [Bifidobacterium pseudolongum subsp. globosum]|uniref:Uncharacterized protein n=1 Tax=Bifidobacterium pseudolongum subsp. globosum TaxID=1690 RepID=A0A4Q5A2C7_9BIFI|nr:hypothetical protein PG2093B_0222 [Bifidobacterium pseudolongum subsp. globosum]